MCNPEFVSDDELTRVAEDVIRQVVDRPLERREQAPALALVQRARERHLLAGADGDQGPVAAGHTGRRRGGGHRIFDAVLFFFLLGFSRCAHADHRVGAGVVGAVSTGASSASGKPLNNHAAKTLPSTIRYNGCGVSNNCSRVPS